MPYRIYWISQIIFNKLQLTSGKTLSRALKNDDFWLSLSGTEHQLVGKTIARYHDDFANNCPIPVICDFSHTDHCGNGIYHKKVSFNKVSFNQ